MTESDLTHLRQHGFADDVLICLTHLGYDLVHHDPVTEEAWFSTAGDVLSAHGITLHRQDAPRRLRHLIFTAGEHHHQQQLKSTLTTLASLAGLQLR